MTADVSSMVEWTEAASKSAPAFFALLYDFFITGSAIRRYYASCARVDPPATPEERKTFRQYLIFSALVGLVFTSLAVGFFWTHQPVYRYGGTIHAVLGGNRLWSNQVYVRDPFDPNDRNNFPRDIEFTAVQDRPFPPNRQFVVNFGVAGSTKVAVFAIPYDEQATDYVIEYDKNADAYVLKVLRAGALPVKTSRFSLVSEAYAQEIRSTIIRGINIQLPIPALPPPSRRDLLDALQGSRNYVGKEIDALDALRAMSPAERDAFIAGEGPDEPEIVTLLDAMRHEDPQLSSKASAIVASTDIAGLFKRKLADKTTRAMYVAALLRIDPKTALAIIKAAPTASDLTAVRKRIESGAVPRLIRPTSSGEGDRYWLSASWSRSNAKAATCAATTLGAQSTLTPTSRQAFSYSKSWVLAGADVLERCGATPGFTRLAYAMTRK
jgi:hypothetical protein